MTATKRPSRWHVHKARRLRALRVLLRKERIDHDEGVAFLAHCGMRKVVNVSLHPINMPIVAWDVQRGKIVEASHD